MCHTYDIIKKGKKINPRMAEEKILEDCLMHRKHLIDVSRYLKDTENSPG